MTACRPRGWFISPTLATLSGPGEATVLCKWRNSPGGCRRNRRRAGGRSERTARIVPVRPVDGEDPTVAGMKADIPKARGRMLLAQGGDWDGGATGGRASWKSERFGAAPPAGLVELAKRASMEVFAACGLSMALFDESDGTSKREAYRQALHGTVAPLGRIVSTELTTKLETPISLD